MRIRRANLVAVLVFVMVTGSMVAFTGVTFSRVRFEASKEYKAHFTDASGLKEGVDVRASGVNVGTVRAIELVPEGVEVSFQVPKDLPVTVSTELRIRYANLTGDRYLELTRGSGDAAPLPAGSTIPLRRTLPALDLDTLFAGFDPLMQALDAREINKLSSNIIAVTQGQAGSVEALFNNIATFTSALTERDELIGDTITNLTDALGTVDDKKAQVMAFIDGLDDLTRGLARDRRAIGESLEGVRSVAADTARLLRRIRPDFKANVDQLGNLARLLNKKADGIIEVLERYPTTIQRLARGGAFGSFFNFFLCASRYKVTLPNLPPIQSEWSTSEMDRCAWKKR